MAAGRVSQKGMGIGVSVVNAKKISVTGRRLKAASLAFILAFSGTTSVPLVAPAVQAAHAATVSMAVRERLTRYGVWQISQRYGEVWVPSVNTSWRPYTVGRWVWTDDGWYWSPASRLVPSSSIMGAGPMTMSWAGSGSPAMNGHRLGSSGAKAMTMSDGCLHRHPKNVWCSATHGGLSCRWWQSAPPKSCRLCAR